MKGKNLTRILMSILLVLLSIAVIVIAFVGIYVPKQNKLKNIIPDYKLGTEVDGIIEYRLVPDDTEEEQEVWVDSKGNIRGYVEDGSEHTHEDETTEVTSDLEEAEDTTSNDTGFNEEVRTIKANDDSVLTTENFEKSKKLLEKKLENAGATEYAIRLDEKTGEMVVELSKNDDVATIYQTAIASQGKFDVIDYQTGVVLLDRSNLKDAQVVTSLDDETNLYDVYLQLSFDEKGAELIREISKKYVEYTDSDGNTQTDRISVRLDGSAIMTTYFGQEYTDSALNIPILNGVAPEDLNVSAKSVDDVATLLRLEEMPVKYVQDGGALFIETGISWNIMTYVYWSIIAILVVTLLVFMIKFGPRGFLAGIMNACLVGLVTLVLKFTETVISISSLVSLYTVIALNIIFLIKYLKKLKNGESDGYSSVVKRYYSVIFPLVIVSFVYTFFVSATVSGFGTVLFLGLLLQIIYNTAVLKYVVEVK